VRRFSLHGNILKRKNLGIGVWIVSYAKAASNSGVPGRKRPDSACALAAA
jgi:hypothetical protein